MTNLKARLSLVLILFLLFITPISDLAVADSPSNFRYGISGNNQVFTDRAAAESGGAVTLNISGGLAATISVELVDIYADASGSKSPLPLNSNPYTPKGLVAFTEFVGHYIPDEGQQKIEIPFRFVNLESISRPVLGGLKITIIPKNERDTGLTLKSSIVSTFAYYPAGVLDDNDFKPLLGLDDVNLHRLSGETFPFSIIPDLPWVFTDAPLKLEFNLKNAGNIFLKSHLTVTANQIKVLGENRVPPIFQQTIKDRFLVPNQSEKISLTVDSENPNVNEASGFPRFGVVRISIVAEGSIGQERSATAITTLTLVFVPWKQLLVVLLIIFAFRRRLIKSFRGIRTYVVDFKRYRESLIAGRQTERNNQAVDSQLPIDLSSELEEGKSNSLGKTLEIIEIVKSNPKNFPQLLNLLLHNNSLVAMRAMNATKRLMREDKDFFDQQKESLIKVYSKTKHNVVKRGLISLYYDFINEFSPTELKRIKNLILKWVGESEDWIILTQGLKLLEKLAKIDPTIQPEVIAVARSLQKDSRKAVVAKAKKFLSGL